jgi:hypothetical protein
MVTGTNLLRIRQPLYTPQSVCTAPNGIDENDNSLPACMLSIMEINGGLSLRKNSKKL